MLNEFKKRNILMVEQATPKDIFVLQDILKAVYGSTPWGTTIFWLELNRKKNGGYYKLKMDNDVIGFVGIRTGGGDAHITNIAVIPEMQGRGYGLHLLQEVVRYAMTNHCKTISLEVKRSNKRAISVYETFGFRVSGVKESYYKDDNEDALEMTVSVNEVTKIWTEQR